ncbi:MAG: VOC family protein [Acidimicrobiales bacterium]
MQPILHLSIPVRDLEEARRFYVDTLGCRAGRARPDFVDVWFYGMQISLHGRPDEVAEAPPGGSRHFGVTLGRDDFEAVVARLRRGEVVWLAPVTTDHPGTPAEQTKTKLADPSGNVIELKTYADVAAALEIASGPEPGATADGH